MEFSIGASHGLSPQSGVPQNNRIGDVDPYAFELVIRAEGLTFAEVLEQCSSASGLLGLCGYNDMRGHRSPGGKGKRALCPGH